MKKSTRLLSLVIVAVLLFCTATVISAAKVAKSAVSFIILAIRSPITINKDYT